MRKSGSANPRGICAWALGSAPTAEIAAVALAMVWIARRREQRCWSKSGIPIPALCQAWTAVGQSEMKLARHGAALA